MESPFLFGKIVKGEAFVNRQTERKRLVNNFNSGINTVLISPRRYGKSSLVRQVALDIQDQTVRFVFIDLFNIRTEEDFYQVYLQQVLKATLTRQNELLKAGKEFFKKIMPVISFSIDPQNDLKVNFNWAEVKKTKDEILNLPEQIGQKKGFKVVVCIDEFQNISTMHDSLNIEKELRSCWQHHQKVSYCLYGSKRHMMKEIFSKEERPFYRFGDLLVLGLIGHQEWVEFICKSFSSTQKTIEFGLAGSIASIAGNHPYYVQQLSHIVWGLTTVNANKEILIDAIDQVISTNSIFYKEVIDSLSSTQVEMINAAIDGVVQFTSAEVMRKYKLGTPNNITKNKTVLENKDIVEFSGDGCHFLDPFFKYWYKKYRF